MPAETPAEQAERSAALQRLAGTYVENAQLIHEPDGTQWLQLVGTEWHATIAPTVDDSERPPLHAVFFSGRETLATGAETQVTEVDALRGVRIQRAELGSRDGREAVTIHLDGDEAVVISTGREAERARCVEVFH